MSIPRKQKHWDDARDRKLNNHWGGAPFGPTWDNDFAYPVRLGNFRYGFNYNLDTFTLAGAIADLTDAQMRDIRDSGIDHVRFGFYVEQVCSRNNPVIDANGIAVIRYVVGRFLQYGINVVTKPDSNGTVWPDLHNDNADAGRWTQANYNQFLTNFFLVVRDVPGVTPETVWLETGNEMGLNVSGLSMTKYNAMLASMVPALRAVAPFYTIVYDLYPYASPGHYTYNGVTLVRPTDKNTVPDVHFYHSGYFTTNQGTGTPTDVYGQTYIYGFTWPMTFAQIQTYLNTWTAGGAYGVITNATNQINNWRTNLGGIVDSDGFTNAAIDTQMAGLLAWCSANKTALKCGEFGLVESQGSFTMDETSAANWTAGVTRKMLNLGVGNCYWQYKDLTTGSPGTRVLNQTKLARNVARRSITNGIRSL